MEVKQTIGRPVNVRVHGISNSPTKMNLQSGKFKMIIDEPRKVDLLYRNVKKFGTIYNTVLAACEVNGKMVHRSANSS
jgi:hypothetical protein